MKNAIIVFIKKMMLFFIGAFILLFLLQHLQFRGDVSGWANNGVKYHIDKVNADIEIKNKNGLLNATLYFASALGSNCYYKRIASKSDFMDNFSYSVGDIIQIRPSFKDQELLYFYGAIKDMRTIFFFGFLIDYDLLFEKWGIFF